MADSELTSSQTLQIAKELLDLGANPNLCDSKQETPLHIAVKVTTGHPTLKSRVLSLEIPETIKLCGKHFCSAESI